MAKYTIYTLSDPATRMPFYVGSTTNKLNQRLNIHMWCAKNRQIGSVYKMIISIAARPIIEPLEVFENISYKEARQQELFWIRQLQAWGFKIVNDTLPFKETEKSYVDISAAEREFLRRNWQYLALISDKIQYGINNRMIAGAINNKSCDQITYRRIRAFIQKAKELDASCIVRRHRVQMVKLNEFEINALKGRLVVIGKKAKCELTGVWGNTFDRAISTGTVRYDKYGLLKKIFTPTEKINQPG